ncbi:hypothetical protein MPTA5024_30755, partial [Microbispora sp. ATCC PTA-5024]
ASALALAAALVAGCQGAGAGPPAASASPSASPSFGVYRELARCIRAHGVPGFPDPVVDSATGRVDFPGADKPPQSAVRGCKTIIDRLPQDPGKNPALTAADMAELRQFARCMRGHGLADWPDPSADGRFLLPQRLTDKRAILTQLQACRQSMPKGRIQIVPPGGNHG